MKIFYPKANITLAVIIRLYFYLANSCNLCMNRLFVSPESFVYKQILCCCYINQIIFKIFPCNSDRNEST